MSLSLSEYKEWLKRNAYQEEKEAVKVVEEIIDHHTWNLKREYKVKIYPRKVFKGVEFDCLIYLYSKNPNPEEKSFFDILIGVEFKETDIRKVISQAIVRREFVDYIYVATRRTHADYTDVFLLAMFGIGWVIWEENFAAIVIPAKRYFENYRHKVDELIDYLLKDKLEKIVADVVDKTLNKKITEFL